MAFEAETYLAEDQLDYLFATTGGRAISKADAYKGVPVTITGGQTDANNRPTISKVGGAAAATSRILGALTHVGNKGCNVVQRRRFVLQAASAFEAADVGKTVIGVNNTTGKVEAGAVAKTGEIVIIDGGNDTGADDSIGHYYLVEKM